MSAAGLKRILAISACALAAASAAAVLPASAPAATGSDPIFVFVPIPPKTPFQPPVPPPYAYFYGPCGLGVDSSGNWYVSDYYHRVVDVYSPNAGYPSKAPGYAEGAIGYLGQFSNNEPLDGPCGLALNASNEVYVNNYHRNVVKFGTAFAAGTGQVVAGPGVDSTHTTGVSVDPATGNVYVDQRTFIGVYGPTGAPVLDGGNPLKIGVGSLADGYGVAYSRYPGTLGYLYVPDAATNTIKVYNPALDKANPIATINGSETPKGGFVSLRDASIAIDRVTGEIYVADDLQPNYTEKPNAIIYVFNPDGTYKGHLKYDVTDAFPVGLAVDNSLQPTQGRVYVTSSNTAPAGVYGYPAGAATKEAEIFSQFALGVASGGSGTGTVTTSMAAGECTATSCAAECPPACEPEILSGATVALKAVPDPGSSFTGWSGACAGTDPECLVTVEEATSVRANFAAAESPPTTAPQDPSPPPPTSGQPAATPAPAVAQPHRGRRHRRHRRHHRNHNRPKSVN